MNFLHDRLGKAILVGQVATEFKYKRFQRLLVVAVMVNLSRGYSAFLLARVEGHVKDTHAFRDTV